MGKMVQGKSKSKKNQDKVRITLLKYLHLGEIRKVLALSSHKYQEGTMTVMLVTNSQYLLIAYHSPSMMLSKHFIVIPFYIFLNFLK